MDSNFISEQLAVSFAHDDYDCHIGFIYTIVQLMLHPLPSGAISNSKAFDYLMDEHYSACFEPIEIHA